MRATNFFNSVSHRTELATAIHNNQSPALSGTVANASFSRGAFTTITWRASENVKADHSHRLVKRPLKALRRSDRVLRALNNCESTSTVTPAVRASTMVEDHSIKPPGSFKSIVS